LLGEEKEIGLNFQHYSSGQYSLQLPLLVTSGFFRIPNQNLLSGQLEMMTQTKSISFVTYFLTLHYLPGIFIVDGVFGKI
jgi:hypothetical protein